MNANADSTPCTCARCPGTGCTCGCQTPVAAAPQACQANCQCGCQQGKPCQCG